MPKAKTMTMDQMLKALEALQHQVEERKAAEGRKLSPAVAKPPKVTPTEERMLLDAAKESLRQFGTLVPPKEALYTVMNQICPHCGFEGSIATEFGFKKLKNGSIKPQSWCRRCRSSPDSHPTRRAK